MKTKKQIIADIQAQCPEYTRISIDAKKDSEVCCSIWAMPVSEIGKHGKNVKNARRIQIGYYNPALQSWSVKTSFELIKGASNESN